MLRLPVLAGSSTPPGSSVTCRPGIPSRPFNRRVFAVTPRFEANTIDRAFDFGNPDDLLDLLRERAALARVYCLAAEAFRLREPFWNYVADDHTGHAQQLATYGASPALLPL